MSEISLYIRKRIFDNFKSKTEDGDRLYMTEAVIKCNDYAHESHIRVDTILSKSNIRPTDNLFEDFYGISVRRADELDTRIETNIIDVLNARCTFHITYRYTTKKMDAEQKTVIRLLDGPDSSLKTQDRACAEFMEEHHHQKRLKTEERKAACAAFRQSQTPG